MISKVTVILFVLLVAATAFSQGRGMKVVAGDHDERVALVIGNGDYKDSPLANPVNDARDMADMLRSLGFPVVQKENLSQLEMKRAIQSFGDHMQHGGTALFYFAGHGIQVRGENYLIPVGTMIRKEDEVDYEAVNAGFVLAQMRGAKTNVNIVILDACRNNPFARSFRSSSSGLAFMNAPTGTLIAYSTSPGSVASDGQGRNSLYTGQLLRTLRQPGLRIEDVFKRVRSVVQTTTGEAQVPWESSSLTGDFYFADDNTVTVSRDEKELKQSIRNTDRPASQLKNAPNPEPSEKVVGMTADGHTIYEGPRGGRYYINSQGNKVYVPIK